MGIVELPLSQFLGRLQRQSREAVSLPEIFEHFGFIIQDLADQNISIAEAFAMFRQKSTNVEVRAAAEFLLGLVDKILHFPKDTRYWEVSLTSEVISCTL